MRKVLTTLFASLLFLALPVKAESQSSVSTAQVEPPAVAKFRAEVEKSMAAEDKDFGSCTYEIGDGSEEEGYPVVLKCARAPFVCLFHVVPDGFATLGCAPNPDYVKGTEV